MLIRDRAVVAAGVSKEDLAQLLTMGFHEQQARAALEARLSYMSYSIMHALLTIMHVQIAQSSTRSTGDLFIIVPHALPP